MDVVGLEGVVFFWGFLVEAAELLVSDHDPGFDDGWAPGGVEAFVEEDAGLVEEGVELVAFLVLADPSADFGPSAEALEVEGDVGGTAGHVVLAVYIDDGYGGFGGDPVGVAKDVAVEHEVSDD